MSVGDDVIATLERLAPIIGHVQIAAVPSPTGATSTTGGFAALERLPYACRIGCKYKPPAIRTMTWTQALGIALSTTW